MGVLEDGPLEKNLMPVIPRSLRRLVLPDNHFDAAQFDVQMKLTTMAAVMVMHKSTKSIRDTERWTVQHVVSPSSSRYAGPPCLRHM